MLPLRINNTCLDIGMHLVEGVLAVIRVDAQRHLNLLVEEHVHAHPSHRGALQHF